MSQLLHGVRVIESAMLFNGDTVGMLLGDQGADVIKVEAPFLGDYLRDFLGQVTPHNSPAHLQVNKNKRSVTLDLRTDRGRDIFFELLATADVFVDGYASDACDRLGIGYEAQRRVKPDIIYCQYTGFGAQGPYSAIPTHGQMMNALAGAIRLRMDPDGLVRQDDQPELMNGTRSGGEGTSAGAAYAVISTLAALYRRSVTGAGAYIDTAGADAVVAAGWIGAVYNVNHDRMVDTSSLPTPGADGVKYQFYETQDKRFVLFCNIEHKFWNNFCRAVGREDLGETKNESTPVDFAGGDLELRHEIQSIIHTRTLEEWVEMAALHDFAVGPAHNLEEIEEDPHLRAREILVDDEHPDAGPFTYVGDPSMVTGQPYRVRHPAPALGENTEEVLADLGYDADAVRVLRDEGVV